MRAPPYEPCPQCGTKLLGGSQRCAACGWDEQAPARRRAWRRAWRRVSLLSLLLAALVLGEMGGTCAAVGYDQNAQGFLTAGVYLLIAAGLLVIGAVMLARRRR